MRKIFCDGCGAELVEYGSQGFTRFPNDVYFCGEYMNGKEIQWCEKCTYVAEKAVKAPRER